MAACAFSFWVHQKVGAPAPSRHLRSFLGCISWVSNMTDGLTNRLVPHFDRQRLLDHRVFFSLVTAELLLPLKLEIQGLHAETARAIKNGRTRRAM